MVRNTILLWRVGCVCERMRNELLDGGRSGPGGRDSEFASGAVRDFRSSRSIRADSVRSNDLVRVEDVVATRTGRRRASEHVPGFAVVATSALNEQASTFGHQHHYKKAVDIDRVAFSSVNPAIADTLESYAAMLREVNRRPEADMLSARAMVMRAQWSQRMSQE